MHAKRQFLVPFLLFAVLLAGCSAAAATPQLIGSYPQVTPPAPNPRPQRVYRTALQIEVTDVGSAASRASQLAYDAGGYLDSSQSWYRDGHLVISLSLAVPSEHFDDLRRSIIALGQLVGEQLSSDAVPWPPTAPYAYIAVTFTSPPPLVQLPAPAVPGWSPAQTFAQAFSVFAFIFTILIDVLIWVSVVAGPFVLMGLGLRWLLQHTRRSN